MRVRALVAAALLVSLAACAKKRPAVQYGPAVYASPYEPAPVIPQGELPPPVVEAPPVVSSAPAEPPPTAEPAAPRRHATVRLLGVQMGLGKADGTAWDFDLGTAPTPDDARAVTSILDKQLSGDDKIAELKKVFKRPTAKVVSKPDVQGSGALLVDGTVTQTVKLPLASDTFSPAWKKIEWKHVPVDATGRIRIMLAENDWKTDESVAPFELTHAHVTAALESSGKPHSVLVADQTGREVLFATITATEE
ncbi:MAG: hypothetical protein HOW73_36065 [Polyangiaceae bacterium]|nr:hypothetical protein [Polyangiaceae bacterium]